MLISLKILGLVFASILMAFMLLCLADAQYGSQDQAAIEAALKGAFLNYEDLPSGLPWQETEVRFNKHPGGFFYANQFWEANIKSEPTKGSYIYEIYKITVGNEFDFGGRFNTAEDYRNSSLKPVEGAIWRVQPYNVLPGGALIWYPDSMPMYQISFWKNINYTGYVEFSYQRSIYPKDELDSDSPERQAEAEAFAHSECERLAKLVYKRLPGEESTSESGYDELLNVLAGYGREPGLWGDKKNATKALDLNRGPEDARIGFPTNKLLYYMLPEIIAVEKMADQLDLECNEPLYESQKGILDLVRPLLPSFEDLLNLPFSNLKKLCDIVKETSSYKFENYVVPNVLEGVYKNYKAIGGGDTEEVKNAFASVEGFYTIKEALGFKDKSDDEFYKNCELRFKLRYECEKSQSEIQYFRDHKKELVGKIIIGYNPTLVKIEDAIRELQSKSS